MTQAVPQIRRLWGVLRPGPAGREVLHLTAHEPETEGMSGVLLLTGMLAGDEVSLAIDLVSDPKPLLAPGHFSEAVSESFDRTTHSPDRRMVGQQRR